MSLLVTAWSVEADEGRRTTVSKENGTTTVKWLCGDARTFEQADLESVLRNLALLEELAVDGAWLVDKDSHSKGFAVAIKGGRFYADSVINDDAYSVPWEDMREALVAAYPGVLPAVSDEE